MKQTAVEWLYFKIANCASEELIENIDNYFRQALEMEKEQIMYAVQHGWNLDPNTNSYKRIGSEYYNETYGGKQ